MRFEKKKLSYILLFCYQPLNSIGEHLSRGSYLAVTLRWDHTETPPDKVASVRAECRFQIKPSSSQQCPEASLPASGLLLNGNNCEADIPGRMFLDIKKKPKPNFWASSYSTSSLSAVMLLVLQVFPGNQRASVKWLFKSLLSQRQRQRLRVLCIESTCTSCETYMYLKGELWF